MIISSNINRYNISHTSNVSSQNRVRNIGLQRDCVSFTSKPCSIENKMKQISGLHDPYSDVVMVTDLEFDKYMRKVTKRPTAQSMLNLLHGYENNLFTPEKEVCEILSEGLKDYKKVDAKRANKIDLHDLLNEYYLGAKVSLARKQLGVLENINDILAESNADTKEKFAPIFESTKETIMDDSFRISPLLSKVRETKGVDRKAKKMILKEMDKFPNSRNSAEVFIVTNAHKTHREIAEAFITPSRVSIEHIRPQTCGGASNASNYLVASKRMNSIRSSMPLDMFVRRNPQVPNCMERYFNDLVKAINKGGLTYLAIALPDVTKTLEKESKGRLQLEIGEISQKETSKVNILKEQLNELIQKFSK